MLLQLLLLFSHTLVHIDGYAPFSKIHKPPMNEAAVFGRRTLNPNPAVRNVIITRNKQSDSDQDKVIELVDIEEVSYTPTTKRSFEKENEEPQEQFMFMSQSNEIDEEALSLSNDPRQTRVILYIILSLIPVLFLVPLMIGSRDLIPLDLLPPVQM